MLNPCSEDTLILASSKINLSDEEISQIVKLSVSINNWEYFTNNVIKNGLGPIIYKFFSSHSNIRIPPQYLFKLKQVYFQSLSRNIIIYKWFNDIISVFKQKGLAVIALKGIFLAEHIYIDIGLRQLSDIDLLIKKEDAGNCINTLIEMGFKYPKNYYPSSFIGQYYESKHYPPLERDGVLIELHQNIHLVNENYCIKIEDYWNRALMVTINGVQVLALSPNDLLQNLCIHLDEHFNEGEIQLRSFCDIVETLKYYENKIDWNSFEASCDLYGCASNIFYILYLSYKYINAPIPEFIVEKMKSYCDQRKENIFIFNIQNSSKNVAKRVDEPNVRKIKTIKGNKSKMKYILGDIFAAKSFMYRRYKIKYKPLVFLFYIKRILTGSSKLFIYFFNKLFVK